MSAAPLGSSDRSAEQRAHEPSMEEILASIRRIIADDQAAAPAEAAAPPPEPPAAASVAPLRPAEVFGLHARRPVAQVEAEPTVERYDDPPPPREPPALRAVPLTRPARPEPPPAPDVDAPLVSDATDAAVASSFNALLASHFLQNSDSVADITRELLRPLLKAWLDDNLPIIVERLVRAEIERVARGGR